MIHIISLFGGGFELPCRFRQVYLTAAGALGNELLELSSTPSMSWFCLQAMFSFLKLFVLHVLVELSRRDACLQIIAHVSHTLLRHTRRHSTGA